MIINVHAGHNADGYTACGAVGLIKESVEDRTVKNYVIYKLKQLGHIVYDCTVDNAASQAANLAGIVKKCNAHTVDLDVSIHFNSGAKDTKGNGQTTGCEVLLYDNKKEITNNAAKNICAAIAALGFKNRGVKYRTDLYVLKNTKAPALLVECCFVDDADDVRLYNAEKMADAIVKGITGAATVAKATTTTAKTTTTKKETTTVFQPYVVKIIVASLNVRKGPGMDYGVVTTVSRNQKFTIVDAKDGWGKLKSGIGWINISSKYVNKV